MTTFCIFALLVWGTNAAWHVTESLYDTDSARNNYEEQCLFALEGDHLLFSSCSYRSSGDTYMRLYHDGEQVAENDDGCCLMAAIEYWAPEDGEYCLHMGCYGTSECSLEVTVGYNEIDPDYCWEEEYDNDIILIVVYSSLFPLQFLLLLIGCIGASCHGGCASRDGCAGSECCCGTPLSWARTNFCFGIIGFVVIDLPSIILLAMFDGGHLWWVMPFMILMPCLHFRCYANLMKRTLNNIHQRLPQVEHAQAPVELMNQAPSPPQQQQQFQYPSVQPQPSQPVQYCTSCGGPFMLPFPPPPQISCPHCRMVLTNQPAAPVAMAVPAPLHALGPAPDYPQPPSDVKVPSKPVDQ